jgi:predicted RNase H-like HicB family nuclease
MRRYLVIVEPAGRNYSAYVPDLPGCAATGDTRHEAEVNIREAIKLHLDGLKQDGDPIPEGRSTADYVDV